MGMDSEERALFAAAIEQVVASADVDAGLDQLGWDDALASDPHVAVAALFEAQGRAGATSGALGRVLGGALATGAERGVLLPPLGSVAPPGTVDGERLVVHGLAVGLRSGGPSLLVVADDGRAHQAGGLDQREVQGLDPQLGLVQVSGAVPASGSGPTVPWTEVVAVGQRALAHELVGACRAMLELARTHALERIQFDVPIASFQAVRHKLAEAYVAIESAASVAEAAWDQPDALMAATAKAVAGRSARVVAKHCQQVLAGIGFTAEHDFHRYLRRTRALDQLLGDTRTLTAAHGRALLDTRQLPPLLPL